MFVGEMLCILPVLYQYFRSRTAERTPHKSTSAYTLLENDDAPSPARSTTSSEDERRPLSPSPALVAPPPPIAGRAMLWLFFPALFDILGTTLMNVGLILVPVSIYQMSRGALVLWVGVLSVVFLRRRLRAYQWAALMIVVAGVAIVGLSGSLVKKAVSEEPVLFVKRMVEVTVTTLKGERDVRVKRVEDEDPAKVAVGVLFILFAQVFTASQFVGSPGERHMATFVDAAVSRLSRRRS